MSGITLTEVDDATIPTPAAGKRTLFADDTVGMAQKDDTGTTTTLTGATGATGATGPSYSGTSTTSLAIGTGSKTFTTQASRAYVAGTRVRAASAAAPTVDFMEGVTTSYSGTSLVVTMDLVGGSGTHTDWNLTLAGQQGASGTASVATDPIWDAAGDLAVGSGADTAARLAKGAAGASLSIINAVVTWNSGTSVPGSAVAGDRFWRTDLGWEIYYDGTRWLTTTLYEASFTWPTSNIAVDGRSATGAVMWEPTYAVWVVQFRGVTYVSGTVDGSNYWSFFLRDFQTDTQVATWTTAADTTATSTDHLASVGASIAYKSLYAIALKTGAPGLVYPMAKVTYRIIVT